MPAETDVDVENLNQGLNTPTFDDDNPPGYGETEEVEETPEEPEATESAEEEEEVVEQPKAQENEEEEEIKPLTRGQQRIQSLANEKKLAEERAKLLEMRLQQLENERQQQLAMQHRPQEEENLSDLEKWQRQADATIRQVQFQNADMADKSEFLMQVSKNTSEAAYIERVEQGLAEARKAGFNPRREDVLIRLMGMDARSKVKAAPAVKRDAAQRITAAKGKPLAAKSNVAATKTESTEYDRLKDIIL